MTASLLPTPPRMLVRVVGGSLFVAGLVLEWDDQCEDFVVVQTAPILHWAMGWRRGLLSLYLRGKGWKAIIVKGVEHGDKGESAVGGRTGDRPPCHGPGTRSDAEPATAGRA